MASQFLTLSEVQSFLGIKSRKTILKYISTGDLSAYKLGGTRWRIARRDVEKFLRRNQVNHASKQSPLISSAAQGEGEIATV